MIEVLTTITMAIILKYVKYQINMSYTYVFDICHMSNIFQYQKKPNKWKQSRMNIDFH